MELLTVVGLGLLLICFVWDKPKLLICLMLIYVCVYNFAISELGIPQAAKYLLDVLNIYIFIWSILLVKKKKDKKITVQVVIVITFFIASIISFVLNRQELILYFWGLRNLYRFFMFFYSCTIILDRNDVEGIFRVLSVVFYTNAFFVTVQYFIQGYRMDYIGGIFGTGMGNNGSLNALIVFISIYAVVRYLMNQCGYIYTASVLAITLYIAALAELKVVFFEVPVIILLSIIFIRNSKRAIALIISGLFGVVAMALYFITLYPYWTDIFKPEALISYMKEVDYGRTGFGINRTDGVSTMYKTFLTDIPRKLFGIGMGAGDYSTYFSSNFYLQNQRYLYTWFTSAWTMLENGIVGFSLYLLFYISVIIRCIKKVVFTAKNIENYISLIVAVIAILYVFYNLSSRTEIAYLTFFGLAIFDCDLYKQNRYLND